MDTLGTLTAEDITYWDRVLLIRQRASQIAYRFAKKTSYGNRMGNTVNWRRYERFTPTTTPLTEGVTPTNTPITISQVTNTVQQYGTFVTISDSLDLMGVDNVMSESTDALGQHGGESIETLIFNTIGAGTNVIYGGNATARNQLTSSMPITASLLRKAIATLDTKLARRFQGDMTTERPGQGRYILFAHPWHINDFYADTELKNFFEYNPNNKYMEDGAIGTLYGVDLFQSTLVPEFAGAGSAGANVYAAILIAQEAFGVVEVGGEGEYALQVQPMGSGGTSDPLKQRGTVGWKAYQAPTILNNNYMVRIETGATNG
jgi:N4-gp56 family major capsid protein